MRRMSRWALLPGVIMLAVLYYSFSLTLFSCGYTAWRLQVAKGEGIYPNAVDGMQALISKGYVGVQRVEIAYANTNSFDGSRPHIWFVVAKVWADRRSDGSLVGNARHDYDYPGSYFLRVKEGWVRVPEQAMPKFIGFWMPRLGLAGEGDGHPQAMLTETG